MNETIIRKKRSLTTEKRPEIAATFPAAVCERLQLLLTYFDVIPYFMGTGKKEHRYYQAWLMKQREQFPNDKFHCDYKDTLRFPQFPMEHISFTVKVLVDKL